MLHATLKECQTSFQVESPVHFSSQVDQRITNTKQNLNIPNEYFSIRKPRGNHGTKTSRLSLQTSRPPVLTTSQPYGLLTPRTPTSSIVVGKGTEPETDWENIYRSYSGDGIGYGMFTTEPYVCLVG